MKQNALIRLRKQQEKTSNAMHILKNKTLFNHCDSALIFHRSRDKCILQQANHDEHLNLCWCSQSCPVSHNIHHAAPPASYNKAVLIVQTSAAEPPLSEVTSWWNQLSIIPLIDLIYSSAGYFNFCRFFAVWKKQTVDGAATKSSFLYIDACWSCG